MPKFCGVIGYALTKETSPGIFEETIIEKRVQGEMVANRRGYSDSTSVNPDITISNRVSIIADSYAREHFYSIRYIEFMGVKWRIGDAEIAPPRIILSLKERYNEQSTKCSANT